MLGPLRMTVAQCLRGYKTAAKHAFTPSQLPARPGESFSATCLEEAIKDIMEEYKGAKWAFFSDKDCCKT